MASANMEKEGLIKQLEFFKEKRMFILVLCSDIALRSTLYFNISLFCYASKLFGTGIQIRSLGTDRHPATRKHMATHEPGITHYFDIWHISKSKPS